MPLLSEPPCPKCGRPLPTRELWELAGYDRLGLLHDKSGIVCPQCGIRLKVIQLGVILSLLLPCLGVGALVALFGHALKAHGMDPKVVGTLMGIPTFMFWIRYGPCFARVREIKPDEQLVYPLSPNSWKNDYLDE